MVVELQFNSQFQLNVKIIKPDNSVDTIQVNEKKPTFYYISSLSKTSEFQINIYDASFHLTDENQHKFNIGTTICYNNKTIMYTKTIESEIIDTNSLIISSKSPLLQLLTTMKSIEYENEFSFTAINESDFNVWEINTGIPNNIAVLPRNKNVNFIGKHFLIMTKKPQAVYKTNFKSNGGPVQIFALSIPFKYLTKTGNKITFIDSAAIILNNRIIYAKITNFYKTKQYFVFKTLSTICDLFMGGANIVMHFSVDPIMSSTDNVNITFLNNSFVDEIKVNDVSLKIGTPVVVSHGKAYYCMRFTHFNCNFEVIIDSINAKKIEFMKHDIFINGVSLINYIYTDHLLTKLDDGRIPFLTIYYTKNVHII